MSKLDEYLDSGDIINIVSLLPPVAATACLVFGYVTPTAESIGVLYGAAGTATAGLLALGHYVDKKDPICRNLQCPNREPSLKEQGYQ
jgi:hypothetical protein